MSPTTHVKSVPSLIKATLKLAILLVGFASLVAYIPSAQAESSNLTLSLSPESPTVQSGEAINFLVIAKDKATDHTWEVNEFAQYTVTDPAGKIDQGTYQAGKVGTWTVLVNYDDTSASTLVRVQPGPVSKIEISPNSKPEIVTLGNRTSFKARVFDALGNPLNNPDINWSLEGLIGTIDSSGNFSGTNSGNGTITAETNGVKSVIDIAVTQPIATTTETTTTEETDTENNSNDSGVFETSETGGEILGEEDELTEDERDEESTSGTSCWDIKWWGWLIVMIGFLALLLGYYYLVRATKTPWLWAVPILLTAAALVIFFLFRCDSTAGWFPWISIIAALLITLFRPMRFIPTNGDNL